MRYLSAIHARNVKSLCVFVKEILCVLRVFAVNMAVMDEHYLNLQTGFPCISVCFRGHS
jgi:hypothetical protein